MEPEPCIRVATTREETNLESRELGLVLAQQLFSVGDLHYGLWDEGLAPTLTNLPVAQQRYTDFLLGAIQAVAPHPARVLDVGCGTGGLLVALRRIGYEVEGVSPAPGLTRLARERLDGAGHSNVRVFECKFEDFPHTERSRAYDVVMFSESFQYIGLRTALERIEQVLRPGGHLIICDFFKSAAHGDGGAADGTFGGGHPITSFYETLAKSPFAIVRDENITDRVAPTLAIADEILMNRLLPASETLSRYLEARRPWLYRAARLFTRRKLEKVRVKYFNGHRTPATFLRYKTYHLIVARAAG